MLSSIEQWMCTPFTDFGRKSLGISEELKDSPTPFGVLLRTTCRVEDTAQARSDRRSWVTLREGSSDSEITRPNTRVKIKGSHMIG